MLRNTIVKAIVPTVILISGVVIFKAIVSIEPEMKKRDVAASYPTVEIVTATPAPTQLYVYSQGTVKPRLESSVKTQVSGEIIWASSNLVEGGRFSQGEKLLEIDSTDYQSEKANADTALLKAETEEQISNREYKRTLSLKTKGLASDAQVDESTRKYRLAQAELREAQVRLASAQKALERTVIYAPFEGRVRTKSVDVGQFISRGEEIAIFYASDAYEISLPIGIDQFQFLNDAARTGGILDKPLAPKVAISYTVGNNTAMWEGRLHRTDGLIDPATRLIHAIARVDQTISNNSIPLLIGMYVQATITGMLAEQIVTLPRSALRENQQVLIVDSESRLRFRKIDILRIQGDAVLVKGGLNAGDNVSVSPLLVVVDGMRVDTVSADRD